MQQYYNIVVLKISDCILRGKSFKFQVGVADISVHSSTKVFIQAESGVLRKWLLQQMFTRSTHIIIITLVTFVISFSALELM